MRLSYDFVKKFKQKYPMTISFRLKRHCEVIDKHLNPGEEILYAFAAQKSASSFDIINTNVIALTNKRLMIATKRILWGYFFVSITPDMFNDLIVTKGLLWGSVTIDTIREEVVISNIDPKALPEIETNITQYMMEEKKKYKLREENGERS